jgi:hypothetical protein
MNPRKRILPAIALWTLCGACLITLAAGCRSEAVVKPPDSGVTAPPPHTDSTLSRHAQDAVNRSLEAAKAAQRDAQIK